MTSPFEYPIHYGTEIAGAGEDLVANVVNGGLTVEIPFAGLISALQPGDILLCGGFVNIVKAIPDDQSITLAIPWAGPTQSNAPFVFQRWLQHTDGRWIGYNVTEYFAKIQQIPAEIAAILTNAQTVRDQVEADRVEIAGYIPAIEADRAEVEGSLALVVELHNDTQDFKTAAEAAAGNAAASEQRAAYWAEKPVDQDVTTPGTRSALHHAAKADAARVAAELAASQAQQGVVPDSAVTDVKVAPNAAINASKLAYQLPAVAGAPTRSIEAKLGEIKSLADFPGGTFDGVANDYAAWAAAINYANSTGGNVSFRVPRLSKLTQALPAITVDHVYFVADGGSTLIPPDGVTCFTWGGGASANWVTGGGIIGVNMQQRPLSTDAAPPAGTRLIALEKAARVIFKNFHVVHLGQFMRCGNKAAGASASGILVDGVRGWGANMATPLFDLQLGSGFFMDNTSLFVPTAAPVHPNPSDTVTGRHGIQISGPWDTVLLGATTLLERFDSPFYALADNGDVINNLWLTAAVMDYCKRGVRLEALAGGTVVGLHMVNSWITPWEGNGVETLGAGTNWGHYIIANRISLCGAHGVIIGANARGIKINDNLIYAVNRQDIGASGIVIAGGVTEYSVNGNTVGIDSGGGIGLPYSPVYGIYISANCDKYTVSGNYARGTTNDYVLEANSAASGARRVINNSGPSGADYSGWQGVGIYAATIVSGVPWVNTAPTKVSVYVAGGTVSNIQITTTQLNFTSATGLTSGVFDLEPGEAITITFSVAPAVRFKVHA